MAQTKGWEDANKLLSKSVGEFLNTSFSVDDVPGTANADSLSKRYSFNPMPDLLIATTKEGHNANRNQWMNFLMLVSI